MKYTHCSLSSPDGLRRLQSYPLILGEIAAECLAGDRVSGTPASLGTFLFSKTTMFSEYDRSVNCVFLSCSTTIPTVQGCTREAMDKAAAGGHLDVLQWLHENRHEGCSIRAMNHASLHGHLHVVRWLHENRREGCTNNAMDNAAKNGHLDIVKFLHENRKEGCR